MHVESFLLYLFQDECMMRFRYLAENLKKQKENPENSVDTENINT